MQRSKSLMFLIGLGLGGILVTAMNYQISTQNNHSRTPVPQMQMPPQGMGQGMGGMQMPPQGMGGGQSMGAMNMSKLFNNPEVSQELATRAGELMRKMQTNPNDAEVLLELSFLFLEAEDYLAMLNFANRASVLDPMNAKAAYFAGIAHSQLQEFDQAIQQLERSLFLQEEPATHQNLASIYLYNLDKKEKAKEHFEKALQFPQIPEDLKTKIEEELKKLTGL